uniref:Neural proliferation, differentiation and control, 1b n=1 Tax=Cynoglossus semilaevis TaxID=244447 RepID=A0A3P8VCL9_CYNSE
LSITVLCLSLFSGSHLCPRSLDCAQAGRHFCQPGRSHCGPCLHHLVENSNGQCVVKRRHVAHSMSLTCEIHSERPVIMSPFDTYRSACLCLPLTICMCFISVMSSVFIVAGSLVLITAGACWRHHNEDVCSADTCSLLLSWFTLLQPGDKKLAHSAQMYHYQHQKQQMLSLEKEMPKVPDSGASTDEENEDGDFTVYECPGLAPTGEMEVKNPLFDDTPLYLHKFR